jgi:sterol desaturase/sphingolipid hydroxylase (fatty acid hydroxylase superfamily)
MWHFLLVLAPAIAAFLAELIFAGVKNSSLLVMLRRFQVTHLADMTCFVSYAFFFQTAVLIGSFGASLLFLTGANAAWGIFRYRLDTHSVVVNLALYFVSVSFLSYWSHRAFHSGRFWNFHRFHHSATVMNPLVEHRNHPMQLAVQGALFTLPLLVISLPTEYVVYLGMIHQLHQMLVHTNIRSSWGWLGRWVLVSPLVHRVHHSIEPRHHNRNFADDLIIWDRLFGTYCDDFAGVGEIGVNDVNHNRYGPIYDVLADYGRAVRGSVPVAEGT